MFDDDDEHDDIVIAFQVYAFFSYLPHTTQAPSWNFVQTKAKKMWNMIHLKFKKKRVFFCTLNNEKDGKIQENEHQS